MYYYVGTEFNSIFSGQVSSYHFITHVKCPLKGVYEDAKINQRRS